MIKIVFFDVDGTLLPFDSKKIPKSTKDALRELRKRGVKTVISTGRDLGELKKLPVMSMNFDGFVTLNGQLCFDDDYHIIASTPIDGDEMKILKDLFNAKKIPFVLIDSNKRYINYVNDLVVKTQEQTNGTIPEVGKYKGEKIYQICAFVSRKERKLLEEMLEDCKITSWNKNGIDIIARGGGKDKGIEQFLEEEGIAKDEAMAFGDGENDISMLEYVGVGVAMGNASDQVKKVANYVTTDVDDDGIANALRHYGLID